MTGRLFGLGVGPGDPELVTLKAARLLQSVPVVAYPVLPGTESFARRIVADLISPQCRELAFEVPMTPERAPAQAAYDLAAERLAQELDGGKDVAVLCEGDPFFYGSFMYLFARLAERFEAEVVPGVTSMTGCAASAGLPLSARNEVVTILPAPLDDDTLTERLNDTDTAVLMKLGRHLPRVRALLDSLGLTAQATYFERASLSGEVVRPLAEAPASAPYFSMILVTKGADPWL